MNDADRETPETRFGRAVMRVRAQKRWSQKELAEALTAGGLKLDATAVSRLENGGRAVKLAEAVKIAEILEIPFTTLVDERYEPEQQFRRTRHVLFSAIDELGEQVVTVVTVHDKLMNLLSEDPGLLDEIDFEGLHLDDAGVRDLVRRALVEAYKKYLSARFGNEVNPEDLYWAGTNRTRDSLLRFLNELISQFIEGDYYPPLHEGESPPAEWEPELPFIEEEPSHNPVDSDADGEHQAEA